MSESKRLLPLSLLAAAALLGGGCEQIKARKTAQEGVEKYKDGELKQAADLFDQAEQISPGIAVITLNRAFTHMYLFQQNPKGVDGKKSAQIAIEGFRRYMADASLKPEQRGRARDYLLQTLVDAGRYEEAIDFFKPQLEKNPPEVEALTIVGNIAKATGRMDEARKWLGKRAEFYPKDGDAFVALAIMDWDELCNDSQCRMPPDKKTAQAFSMPKEKRIEVANRGIEKAQKAVELSPTSPTPLVYWNLLLRERQFGYETDPKIPVNPKDPKYQAELDRVDKLKKDDLDKAAELVKKAMELQKAASGQKPGEAKPGEAKAGDAKAGDAKDQKAATPEKK